MYLGLDCGTQGTKALLVDDAGRAHGRGYARHELIERVTGGREQQPVWWVDAAKTAIKSALATAPEGTVVRALGVSGQQHGLVVLDEWCNVVRPAKLWNDTETAPQNSALIARLGGPEVFFERFGILPMPGYTVSKLAWLAECEPENFSRVRYILLPHEYLNFWLTGKMCAEFGDASGTGFFDVRTRQWTREVLDAIDGGSGHLFAALPRLVDADSVIGTVLPQVATELGLMPGCVVSSGGGDNMMGAIGTANVREGVVTLSLGTSATVYSFSNEVAHDPSGNIAPFCSSSGGWLPLVCTMNATNVVTGTIHLLGRTVADIEPALAATLPGADGLVFLPFLNGERTPDLPQARGSLHGISATNFTPDHVIRAAVEGVSFGILDGLDLVLDGKPANVLQVIGGGSRSQGWKQLLADATGATVHVPTEEEAGCLGAAIQAIVAYSKTKGTPRSFENVADQLVHFDQQGTCTPHQELREAYHQARAAYRKQLGQMYPSTVTK